MENNIVFIFRAYYSKEDYEAGNFFSQHILKPEELPMFFIEHMKTFSSIHKEYIAVTWKVDLQNLTVERP